MEFGDLILLADGTSSVQQISTSLQLSTQQTHELINTVSPIFIAALHRQTADDRGRFQLRQLVQSGGPQQFIDKPLLLDASVADIEGHSYLRHLFATDAAIGATATFVSKATGIDVSTVQRALPRLASIFFGAICKKIAANL